jgi:hypothetical protein
MTIHDAPLLVEPDETAAEPRQCVGKTEVGKLGP